jgi:hypothetical protein
MQLGREFFLERMRSAGSLFGQNSGQPKLLIV